MLAAFDLQGHRGARGLKPENTLPAFEVAFDLGVTSVETDVHLTQCSTPVLLHDPFVSQRLCRRLPNSKAPPVSDLRLVRSLPLDQFHGYVADVNPDLARFSQQNAAVTPVAWRFMEQRGLDPYTPPTLADLFAFAEAYAGRLGELAGKPDAQRAHAQQVRFDLELKRVPYHPVYLDDGFNGRSAGLLERKVVEAVKAAGMLGRTVVRSFDHRAVRAVRRLQPGLLTAVLVEGTAPVSPVDLVRRAGATVYCPEYHFLDEAQVRHLHAARLRVVPWTVNEPADWDRLLAWGVDGITTDYPDRLAEVVRARGLAC